MEMKYVIQRFLAYCFLAANFVFGNAVAQVYLDASFGSNHNGIVTTTIGSSAWASTNFIQADGSIVLAGTSVTDNINYITLARYTSLGILDNTFGSSGIVTSSIGSYDEANSGFVQADGKLVAAGQAVVSGINNLVLTRYATDGTPDAGFGTSGVVTTALGDGAGINAAVLQPADQYIVGVGSVSQAGVPQVIIARYDTAGTLDTAGFGNPNGYTITPISFRATGRAVALQPDGKILVGGFGVDTNTQNGAILRYTTAGVLDTATFGSGVGYILEPIPGASSTIIVGLGVQSTGKIIALMQASVNNNTVSYLARYNTDGSLDTAFGSSGFVTIDANGIINGNALFIQSNDAIVVAGYSGNAAAVMRYLADGSALDTTFGNNGIVTTAAGSGAMANSVSEQSDGKIIIAGMSDTNFFVARYFGSNTVDSISIDSPLDGSTITTPSFTISGSATQANKTVKVKIDSIVIATTTTDANGFWNAGSFTATNGAHTIDADLYDGATLLASATQVSITVSLGADSITIASPANGSLLNTSTINIVGGSTRSGYSVEVSLDDVVIATVTTNASGQWDAGSWFVADGAHKVDVALLSTSATATSNFTVSSLVGPIGPTGFSGATGISGLTGSSGITGLSGQTGFSGITGLSGITGMTGLTGVTGAQGSGITGQSGSTGLSGLTGMSGTTGLSGLTGFSGVTGRSGVTGATGVTGFSGMSGASGLTGGTGITGFSGTTGFSGQTGFSGTTGLSGQTGLSGTTGLSGMTGMTGLTGLTGASIHYVYAYQTGTLTVPNTAWNTVTFNNITISDGWTYSAGFFTCPATGLYLVNYFGVTDMTANTNLNYGFMLATGATPVEIAGTSVRTASTNTNIEPILGRSAIVSLNSGSLLSLRFSASNTNGRLAALIPSGGGTAISVSMNIIRLR